MRRSKEFYIIGAIVIWFTVLIVIFHSQTSLESSNDKHSTMKKALQEMTELQKQNEELNQMVKSFRKLHYQANSSRAYDFEKLNQELAACKSGKYCRNQQEGTGVTKEREVLLRRSKNNLVELWYAFERQLNDVKDSKSTAEKFDNFKASFATQINAAIIDVEDLQSLYDNWREMEAKELIDLVQSKIKYLQNPKDCSSAKKLVCNLNKACGFGCQIHHLAYCAMVAFGTERTLVIESTNWRYNSQGYEAVFLPASETCTEAGSTETWRGEKVTKNVQNVLLPIVDGISNPPPYLPLGFPEFLADRLLRLHGNPSVWWTGQFIHYLMRPQPWLEELLQSTIKASGFETPCVGVHVRRTDKVSTEAAYHGIEEYMKHVKAWYDKHDLRLSKEKATTKSIRRVYLASDDSSVLPEAKKKYPDYVFYGDTKIAESAGLSSRYSKASLRGVLVDIFMLSKCDFLSCTFSSQVCRVAYELMQALVPDAADRFHSLDDIYYYGGQTGHQQRAIYPHTGTGAEISLEVGDLVGIAGNHWDGYSKGTNKRTRSVGLYPSYKVKEVYSLVKYPIFDEAKSKK